MEFTVRKAVMEDYESVVKIMNQVQQMHVDWRPDIYNLGKNRDLDGMEFNLI